jgi:hypothetical protein
MADESDDVFNEDGEEAGDRIERLTDDLFQHISEFADEEDIPDEALSLMLLRLALTLRMMTYPVSVAKPSASGLKLELDRFRQDAEGMVRAAKKDAEQFIATAKEEIAAAEADGDEGEGEK